MTSRAHAEREAARVLNTGPILDTDDIRIEVRQDVRGPWITQGNFVSLPHDMIRHSH